MNQSNLIMSIIQNKPIKNLSFLQDKKGNFEVIDEKQRTKALLSFVQDGFLLSPDNGYRIVESVDDSGEPKIIDVTGKKFSELNNDLKNRILEYQLSIKMIDSMDADERGKVFW